MKIILNKYKIEHQGKKFKPCNINEKAECDVQVVCDEWGDAIIYHSLIKVKKEIAEMAIKNKYRRFRFVKISYSAGDWSDKK